MPELNYEFQYFTPYQSNHLHNNLIFTINSNIYMDTKNNNTLFLLKKALNILTINDDKLWWLRKFIIPIENSLILYKYIPNANNNISINNNVYYECWCAYFKLLKKLNITESLNLIYQTI